MASKKNKTIIIDPVTRIEGHARIKIELDADGKVVDAVLVVLELRGFEKILTGMEAEKMPLVTGRICGVCPTAHHLASAKTLDRVYNVEPPPAAHALRELMYMGHLIHSHTLALFVLAGPDLILGPDADPTMRNIVGVVQAAPAVAKKALRLRSLGQKINETIGGRGVHPVTAVAGGISFTLTPEIHQTLKKQCAEAADLGFELAGVVRGLLFKFLEQHPGIAEQFTLPTYSLGTVKDGKLNLYQGDLRIMDPAGKIMAQFDVSQYAQYLTERAVDWSYMKPVYVRAGDQLKMYRVNTLARINVADAMETPLAQKELQAFRKIFGRPCHVTLMHHYARLIELIYVCEKAKALVNSDVILGPTHTEVRNKPGPAIGHVEAPRGTLIHDYDVDEQGIMRHVNLIVATQQNYAAINETIRQAAEHYITGSDDDVLNWVEFAVRSYDPCLSCATHAYGRMPMVVEIIRQGELVRRVMRG